MYATKTRQPTGPQLVVSNVRLYHSHGYSFTLADLPNGKIRASVAVNFYDRAGDLYSVKRLAVHDYFFASIAGVMAKSKVRELVRMEALGHVLPQVAEEKRRIIRTVA